MSNKKNVSANGKPVPAWHWMVMVGVVAGVVALGATYAKGAERGDLGYITEGTNLCHADSITSYRIEALRQWTALIERLEAAGGAAFLSEEDNDLGSSLSKWCSTLGTGYPVVVFHVDREHALVVWEKSLDFGDYTFIIRLRDFQEGGLRL